MVGLWDELPDSDDEAQAPICGGCGVTALASEHQGDDSFVCENPDCPEFGELVPLVR